MTDGAAVYPRPDFDSPVQDYLGFKTPVVVSRKPYAGAGGLGLFHRVRYAGKMGFVTDTDIRASKREAERSHDEKRKSPSKAWAEDEDKKLGKAPLYLSRHFGLAGAIVQFSEKFSGHRLSDNMPMYGFRLTGPGTLFDGPPLDFNFWFSLQQPRYFSKFASGNSSGFLLFGDVMALLPMVDFRDFIINYGIGLMWTYTHYMIPVKNTFGEVGNFDSQEFRMGVDFGLGLGQRFGRYLLRADAKYYIEKTSYPGFVVSFQMEY